MLQESEPGEVEFKDTYVASYEHRQAVQKRAG